MFFLSRKECFRQKNYDGQLRWHLVAEKSFSATTTTMANYEVAQAGSNKGKRNNYDAFS